VYRLRQKERIEERIEMNGHEWQTYLDPYHGDRDYYDDGPDCPICNDNGEIKGFTGTVLCVCPAGRAIAKERLSAKDNRAP
jgi:hypothetical protein